MKSKCLLSISKIQKWSLLFSLGIFYGGACGFYSYHKPSIALLWIGALILAIYLSLLAFSVRPSSIRIRGLDILIAFFFLSDFLGLLLGLILDNPLRYVIGDTASSLVIPSSYFVFLSWLKKAQGESIRKFWIFLLGLISALYSISIFVHKQILIMPLVLLSAAILGIYFTKSNKLRLLNIFIFILGLFSIIISGRRTPLVLALLAIMIFAYFSTRIKGTRLQFGHKFQLAIPIILVFAVFLFLLIPEFHGTHRILQTSFTPADMSIYNRFLEVKDVMRSMSQSPFLLWITGRGNGALWKLRSAHSLRNIVLNRKVHNIHIFFISRYFRQGLLGFTLLIILGITIFQYSRKLKQVLQNIVNFDFLDLMALLSGVLSIQFFFMGFATSRAGYWPLWGVSLAYLRGYLYANRR